MNFGMLPSNTLLGNVSAQYPAMGPTTGTGWDLLKGCIGVTIHLRRKIGLPADEDNKANYYGIRLLAKTRGGVPSSGRVYASPTIEKRRAV